MSAKSIIIASGGFEANIDWLRKVWGESADRFIIRGSKYNKGYPLKSLLENGAKLVGSPRGAHMIAVDERSPKYDGGIVTRVDAIPIGIVVNKNGRRFYDEGQDIWPKRYAIWGHLIAEQQDQIAFCIVDSKMLKYFIPPMFDPFKFGSIEEIANKFNINRENLINTIKEFNNNISRDCQFDLSALDHCSTKNIDPPKSNWATELKGPPFYVYPLRPGITFTYMGIKINKDTRIVTNDGNYFENAFGVGELVSGNILRSGYLGGFGIAIGSTLGRIAGNEASKYVGKFD